MPIFMRVGISGKEYQLGKFETDEPVLDMHELANAVREVADAIDAGAHPDATRDGDGP